MRLAHRHFLRIAAVFALTAASTSAFAQSAEYRRGYDDGYAAGQRAARDGHHGPGRDRVLIEEAEYGARGAMCNARDAVQAAVDRNGGNVVAGNQLCGDPARGQPKHLRVLYRCAGTEAARTMARENETLRLSCARR